jgi:hypothetical protein
MRPIMKGLTIIAMFLALGGCGLTDGIADVDIHAIKQCAAQHPPPPQANVERLGLLPVYFTRSAASGDAATLQWYTDMDVCTARLKSPASGEKAK